MNAPTIMLNTEDGKLLPSLEEEQFFRVLKNCFDKFIIRNRSRGGVWSRSGLRGQTHEVFAKAERAYHQVFVMDKIPDEDHFQDIINYSIFALLLIEGAKVYNERNEFDFGATEFQQKLLYGSWPQP